jgi:hypothetical protein
MIPVTLLEFTLSTVLDLGANPGSSLRGALYETLAAMYDTGDAAQSRHDVETNPVAWLLRLEDYETSGGKDVPRPLAIRPPMNLDEFPTRFGMVLYGRGREALPMILSAVAGMQTIGLGRGRKPFRLHSVHALDPLTRQRTLLLEQGRQMTMQLPDAPGQAAYEHLAAALKADQLTVRFLTPTRIIQQERLCHEPVFRVWFQRLLERIRLLSELYSEPVWIPFKEVLAVADDVTISQDATRWKEAWSYSRYEGMGKPTSGFVGEVTYTGSIAPLLPYLLIGQALQVGKNTVKGCGWYEIVYQWR